MTMDFSFRTMEVRTQYGNIFKELREKNYQPRILYPAKLVFRNEGKIKMFSDKENLKASLLTNLHYKKMLRL